MNGLPVDSGLTGGSYEQVDGRFWATGSVTEFEDAFCTSLPQDVITVDYDYHSPYWENENSFEIIDSSGNIIYSDGPYINTDPVDIVASDFIIDSSDCDDSYASVNPDEVEICEMVSRQRL